MKITGKKLLTDAEKVSHAQAIEKANWEYQKYTLQNFSPMEEAYQHTIKKLRKKQREEILEGGNLCGY